MSRSSGWIARTGTQPEPAAQGWPQRSRFRAVDPENRLIACGLKPTERALATLTQAQAELAEREHAGDHHLDVRQAGDL